jgi:type IX secretion system PorP/SprF family membrane protein
MRFHFQFINILFLFIIHSNSSFGQENTYSHFFTASSFLNPAFAGDTRFASFQADNRLVKNTGAKISRNTMISFDQKIPNYRSGLSVNINQNSGDFNELKIKGNYSYTFSITKRYWLKTGVGFSWNFVNTNAQRYKYPDQFNQWGYTGQETQEPSLNERDNYPGFAAGLVIYDGLSWLSFSVDDINSPKQDFAGTETHVPVSWSLNGSYMIPIDKGKKSKRIFATKGGIEPYSSIGPVVGFYKKGPFNITNFGINGFIRPIYFGAEYRYNSFGKNILTKGISTLGLLVGYRNESLSIAYSYDFRIDRNDVNYRGAHEISLVYYLYTIKKDYIKNKLVPLPNQLMY